MLVEVWRDASTISNLTTQTGTPATVSGLAASTTDEAGSAGPCTGLGADRSRTLVIPYPSAPDNWIEVAVCSRGVAEAAGARIMESVAVTLPD
jgi:hypothetical protein